MRLRIRFHTPTPLPTLVGPDGLPQDSGCVNITHAYRYRALPVWFPALLVLAWPVLVPCIWLADGRDSAPTALFARMQAVER